MFYCLLCYYIFAHVLASGEVITVKTNETINCVLTDHSVYSALDIVPPLLNEQVIRPKNQINDWSYNDWKNDTDNSFSFDVVTDQRWEEFQVRSVIPLRNRRHNHISICLHNSSLVFTARSSSHKKKENTVWFGTVSNVKNIDFYCQWLRIVVTRNGRSITIESITKQVSFDPEWLLIDSHSGKQIKSPYYDFYSSNNTSSKESCVTLNISECVFMFVSVDKHCFLDINLKIGNKIVNHLTVEGFNEDDVKTWRKVEIKSIFQERGKLCFFRGTRHGSGGYWAVDDIQLCKPKIEIYKKQFSGGLKLQICRGLDPPQEFSSGSFACPTPGFIGKHCNITCQEVLGENYSYCENHKICLPNGNCHCAWGYQGEICNKICENGRWGLNCTSTCNSHCETCNPVLGCVKCKKKIFGRHCSEKLPMLRNGPVITAITNNSVQIIQNMEYGVNDTKPEFYIAQYKKMGDVQYQDYLTPRNFTSGNITVTIGNLALAEFSYKIRIILLVQNQSFDGVPELEVYKTNAVATYAGANGAIQINWNRLNVGVSNYTVEWKCKKYTELKIESSGSTFTATTFALIEDLKLTTYCITCQVDLFAKLKKDNQLIAQTEFDFPKAITDCANVNLLRNKILVELKNCPKFIGIMSYRITYRCICEWCFNETSKSEDIVFYGNSTTAEKQVMGLKPFTNFTIKIIETMCQSHSYKEINLTTPADTPTPVQNLSVYCENDTMLWIRWKEPYPPTGILESYNISYSDFIGKHSFLYSSTPCESWREFICANITLHRNRGRAYRITVQAKNFEVSEWSIPNELISDGRQNDLSATTDYVNVVLLKNKIVLELTNCGKLSDMLSYRITYRCISKWCSNESSTSEDIMFHKNDTTRKIVMGLRPFTNFSVNLTESKKQNEWHKEMILRTPADEPAPVQDLSVYWQIGTKLWIRWREPYPHRPTGILQYYNITYYDRYEIRSLFIDSSVPYCELWDKFLCANITRSAKNEKEYRITIQAKNYNVSALSEEREFTSDARQNAFDAPEDLTVQFSTMNEIALTWKNPWHMNGPLKFFCIEINSGGTIDVPIKKYQRIYKHMIPVENGRQYNISLWGKNQIDGAKATINVTILKSPVIFSQNLFVEWCSKSCYLLLPKVNFSFQVIVIEKNTRKIVKTIYKSSEEKSPRNALVLEIGETPDQAVSWRNQTHQTCLEFNGTRFGIEYKPFRQEIKKTQSVYIGATVAGALIIIILFFLIGFFYCRRKKGIGKLLIEMSPLLLPSSGSKPIDVKDFENDVSIHLEELRSIPVSMRSSVYASKVKNRNKNREPQNVPYDNCRVVLTEMDGMGTNDYINASYINGYDQPKTYIATQGPKFFTLRDFWRMIWQQKVQTIVMAAHFIENKKRTCAKYFPQKLNTVFECGKMSIKLIGEDVYEHYYHKIFEVSYGKCNRKVEHLQLKWSPDDLTPLYPNCVVPLVKWISHIRQKSNNTPIVIHCSDGVNRTGTLILCDLALQMAKIENTVDFYSLVKNMRDERPNMVNSEWQYILSHLIVVECLMEDQNIFKKTLSDNLDPVVLKSQLKYLDKLGRHDKMVQSWAPDRSPLYTPSFSHSFVDSYAKTRKYLVVPHLSKKFLHDFWDLIFREKVRTILFLHKMQTIWPYEIISSTRIVRVEHLRSDHKNKWYTSSELLLRTFQQPKGDMILEHRVYLFQINHHEGNSNLKYINEFINIAAHFQQNYSTQSPILVGCRDGITTSGLFLALSYVIQKYQNEREIDVCNAVRTIRRSGIQFIKNKEQMEFLYKAAEEYTKNLDAYSSAQ